MRKIIVTFYLLTILFIPQYIFAQTEMVGCWVGGECQMVNIEGCTPCDFGLGGYTDASEFLNSSIGSSEPDDKSLDVLKKSALSLNPMDIGRPTDLLSRGINALLAFMGSIALVLYIFAGFLWMSAAGNAEKVNKAQKIMIWTTLGAVAMGGSYMIVRTILERVG